MKLTVTISIEAAEFLAELSEMLEKEPQRIASKILDSQLATLYTMQQETRAQKPILLNIPKGSPHQPRNPDSQLPQSTLEPEQDFAQLYEEDWDSTWEGLSQDAREDQLIAELYEESAHSVVDISFMEAERRQKFREEQGC